MVSKPWFDGEDFQGGGRNDSFRSGPHPPRWAREIGTICPFSPILLHFLAQFGGNPCSEASCGVVTLSLVLKAFQVVLGGTPNSPFVLFGPVWPFQAPKTLRFKGEMAKLEAEML